MKTIIVTPNKQMVPSSNIATTLLNKALTQLFEAT